MVTCTYTTDLACYVLGSLDPAERVNFEAHLPGCESCRDELASLAGLPGLLSRVSAQEARAGLPAAPARLLEDLLVRAAGQHRTRRRWLLAAAAALILVVGGISGGIALVRPGPGGATVTAANGPVSVHVRVTGTPGGSKITLRLSGVPSGQECRLVAIGKDGSAHDAGSWYASYRGEATVNETAALAPSDLASLRVETLTGNPLVTVQLAG